MISGLEPSWTALVARVVATAKIKPQCSQILEEGGQNERLVAIGRMVRSTVFVSTSIRPSSRNTVRPAQWPSIYLIASTRLDRLGQGKTGPVAKHILDRLNQARSAR